MKILNLIFILVLTFLTTFSQELKYDDLFAGKRPMVQKPEALTTFSWSDCINNIYLDIKDLTPAIDGQLIPDKSGQWLWLFHP